MTQIDEQTYRNAARALLNAAGNGNFFNGRVEGGYDGNRWSFTSTLLIYRRETAIHDIVPVWWEFRLHASHGELLTDFSWSELRNIMADYFLS